ncbi:hypothetical protein UFOVP301_42 [uncultured Caudovirales phage]|uniref:Uncharacterized protein n=1 Tax=uncultured Caudovirales phage TaxID=2100421 RepID=A0A6J5N0P4_9CAUD|nr:hypothetical protein UFOVP301_42 [uncultured Caudovirales phage]CAB4150793.1 hypothetical protein UFOVP576_30 [uncultured Caudovirales phage]CAB4199844.1 hypothetical protein UFOVP1350_39 [uncultured Caudovirales phage]
MNISITLTLNQEQSDALQERVDLHNSSSSTSITPSEFLKISELDFYIQTLVDQRYAASVQRIGTTAASLPYAERQALIAQIEAQLP